MPVRFGRRGAAVAAAATCAVLAVSFLLWHPPEPASDAGSSLVEAQAALRRRQYARAEELASRVPRDGDSWARSRLVAGEAATRAGRLDDAAAYYETVPRDGSRTAVQAVFALAEVRRGQGRLTDAEAAYAYVLGHKPDHIAARQRMAFLLGVTGRRWESLPHFLFLVRSGDWTVEQLVLLGDLERPIEQAEFLEECSRKAPDDLLVRLGLAADAVAAGRSAEAERLLREVIRGRPDLAAAQAMLGELLAEADDSAFAAWHADLPSEADADPDVWYARGLRARRIGDLPVAARCFWEAARRAPAHRRAHVQLGQVLGVLGGHEEATEAFSEKAGRLVELTRALDDVLRSKGQSEKVLRIVAELTETTGRLWEARAWCAVAAQTFPNADWPRVAIPRLSAALSDDTPQTIASADLALRYDLSDLPGHTGLFGRAGGERHPMATGASSIRYEDISGTAGIDFAYANGADTATPGARMPEQTGGGVAAFDYDADGWTDLFFTQGADWPTGAKVPAPSPLKRDRLYRKAAGRGNDVTAAAGVGDTGFGQGCANGDFDDDGFTDLYVANIGRNSLYRNNGDGTFSDVTAAAGIEGTDWTASCVVVDLNADGLPDLFDVTYLTGADVYEAICDGHACSPKGFPGAPDRLWISRGDGTFFAAPDAGPRIDSKGLGVVAADIHFRGRPSLFIANDQVPNFLLRNVPDDGPAGVLFGDDAFAGGVAFNQDGLAMASMGVAADDADGDGRLDFFVTTFKDEPKTLFLQDAPGLFLDATNAAGLRAVGWPYVGWGTQFLDADLDGEPDLVAVNGHVDDYRREGGQYQMRPQFFRNTGGGRFVELSAAETGPYFTHEYLGRGLARLDWDRDGRTDFAVSNIADRASLVVNRSTGGGRFVNVRLHATATARDAIGAVVEVVTRGRTWVKQLTAGDGYMASNERQLQFGLGDADAVERLRVRWPSGTGTTLLELPADSTVELVEGLSQGTLWRGGEPQPLEVR